jgi:S-adenosylmethionine-dependent methyltransferase
MNVGPDVNFDGRATSFEEAIYGSSRGYVRLGVLWEDLLVEAPEISRGGLSILDAGGGAGHIALLMAEQRNRVLLCDPSREMLDRAENAARDAGLWGMIITKHSTIQDLDEPDAGFDVITCHAVLEWLADPEATLKHLVRFLKRDGLMSLMFYNQNAAILKRIFCGDFAEALQGLGTDGQGCTPLPEEAVRTWLADSGMSIKSKSGVRMFHDHLPQEARDRDNLDDLLHLEKALRKTEPFASLGQHVHLVCERTR